MPTSTRATGPKHRKTESDSTAAGATTASGAADPAADSSVNDLTATEPTAADLDLSGHPELLAIPDPADIVDRPSMPDLSDPDTVGELDPDQTIALPAADEGDDDLHSDDLNSDDLNSDDLPDGEGPGNQDAVVRPGAVALENASRTGEVS